MLPLGAITGTVGGGASHSLVTVTYMVTGWHAAGALGEAGGAETGGMDAGGIEAGGMEAGGIEAGGIEAGGIEAGADGLDSCEAGGMEAGMDGIDCQEAGGLETGGVTSVTGQTVVEIAIVFVTTAVV